MKTKITKESSEVPVKLDLPHDNMVLILGILSVGLCLAGGLPGLISALLALKIRKKPEELYKYAPELYNKSSYGKIQAGKVMSYIGIVFSGFVLLAVLIMFPVIAVLF